MIVIEDNKDNRKPKENNDVPSLNGEEDNEDSSTTQEAVIGDGRGQQQQQQQQQDIDTVIVIAENKGNEKQKENNDVPTVNGEQDKYGRLLSFIFKMRETGMAVSLNSIVLKELQLSREFREKRGTQPCIDSSMFMVACIGWGLTLTEKYP